MEVLAMGLHAKERRKLRQIEEGLRRDDPSLDTLLAGRLPPRPPAHRAQVAWALAAYLVPPVLILAGLLLHATWLLVAGVVSCPFIPVITWMLIRRHSPGRGSGHFRKP